MKRSKWKFLNINYKFLKNLKLEKNKISNLRFKQRHLSILPYFINKKIFVYNGKNFIKIFNEKTILGDKLGAFSFSRKLYKSKKSKKK